MCDCELCDCEFMDRLLKEKAWLEQRSEMLDKLLFGVKRKFPGETRFDTALRYIREAEEKANDDTPKMVMPNA